MSRPPRRNDFLKRDVPTRRKTSSVITSEINTNQYTAGSRPRPSVSPGPVFDADVGVRK